MPHLTSSLVSCLIMLGIGILADAAEAPPAGPARYAIWKLDDLRAGPVNGVAAGFDRVVKWCTAKHMKASLGIICNSLDKPPPAYVAWITANAIENGGLIEFWNHGWDHSRNAADGTTEFKGPDLAFQLEHLTRANRFMKEATGLVFHTFGAPFNATDAATDQAMGRIPEFKVWLYGPKTAGQDQRQLLVLKRVVNLEYETGKVSEEKFLGAYPKAHAEPYLVLQGHAAQWNDASFEAFTAIAGRLAADGWSFITPYEYYRIAVRTDGIR